jgi:L-alanine-DL-glutamate epimerase-like enolase superfamily enzyme
MLDDLLTEELPIASLPRWGRIDRPGLGVDVDPEKLRHLHMRYKSEGQFLAYNQQTSAAVA